MTEQEKPKTKTLLKAEIKLHQEVKQKIDKTTEIIGWFLIGIIIILIILIAYTITAIPEEAKIPSENEIKTYCEQKNMLPNGYIITYEQEKTFWIFNKRSKEQTYIQCKKPYQ